MLAENHFGAHRTVPNETCYQHANLLAAGSAGLQGDRHGGGLPTASRTKTVGMSPKYTVC